MKSSLIRTSSSGSLPVHSSFVPSSPRVSVPGKYSGERSKCSPTISLHFHVNQNPIRRASSESDLKISGSFGKLTRERSQSFPAIIPEEDYFADGSGALNLTENGFNHQSYTPVDELTFSGDGIGKGRAFGGGYGFGSGGGSSDRKEIGAYYEEMLKSDPMNSLLLRNYGKFLHEVEGDSVKAEECYGRAILASPGDGEVLSLYAKFIWETQRDGDRAKSYFNQAVQASPHDSMVMGSYAQFMWEAEDDEEDEGGDIEVSQAAMVEAY
ncbi:Adenosine monophosphate-protein like [Heracleum sosnowskyi]|uniref:Adenosine monophosphate-protein like n=1 Tax=Heracleum sosnowskyi TaxID=360622 RepID=A0AAD8MJD3_9APIA|nr:Adenosine monophosphate-protein like [Heracleum sosnowskyi]